jgi:hypothetical protein
LKEFGAIWFDELKIVPGKEKRNYCGKGQNQQPCQSYKNQNIKHRCILMLAYSAGSE